MSPRSLRGSGYDGQGRWNPNAHPDSHAVEREKRRAAAEAKAEAEAASLEQKPVVAPATLRAAAKDRAAREKKGSAGALGVVGVPFVKNPKPPAAAPDQEAISGFDPATAARIAIQRVETGQDSSAASVIAAILAALPVPHPIQQRILASSAKRKVINTGRRVGKTTLSAWAAAVKLTEGRRVLIASTTQEQADAAWEKLTSWLKPWISERGPIVQNSTKHTLTMEATGGRIKCKTAHDENTLRGDYADFLVLDECALLPEEAWTLVGAPMLLDNDGDCWFLSTPRRRNWFFGLNVKAEAQEVDDEGGFRWEAFHATSYDNPHLSAAALAEIMEDLTEEGYRQEILAEFLEGQGAVFRSINEVHIAPPSTPKEHFEHFVVAGLDWGETKDYTVLSVWCATCMKEIHMERFNQVGWRVQYSRLVNAVNTWNVSYVLGELNSIGGPNCEALVGEGVPLEGFDMQMNSKPELVRAFALGMEREEFQLLNIGVAKSELEAYEGKRSKITSIITYSAASGHDDTVIARMLSYRAAKIAPNRVLPTAQSYAALPSVASMDDGAYDVGDSDWVGVQSYAGALEGNLSGSMPTDPYAMAAPIGRPW